VALRLRGRTDADAQDGDTPLHWGVTGGHTEVARLLLEHGGDVASENNVSSSATPESPGFTLRSHLHALAASSPQRCPALRTSGRGAWTCFASLAAFKSLTRPRRAAPRRTNAGWFHAAALRGAARPHGVRAPATGARRGYGCQKSGALRPRPQPAASLSCGAAVACTLRAELSGRPGIASRAHCLQALRRTRTVWCLLIDLLRGAAPRLTRAGWQHAAARRCKEVSL
jgi:hypothetical protein